MSRGDEGHAVLRGVTAKAKNMQLKDARAGDSNSRSGTFLPVFSLVLIRWKVCFSEGKVWLSFLDVIVITVTQIKSLSTSIKAWQPGVKVSPAWRYADGAELNTASRTAGTKPQSTVQRTWNSYENLLKMILLRSSEIRMSLFLHQVWRNVSQ